MHVFTSNFYACVLAKITGYILHGTVLPSGPMSTTLITMKLRPQSMPHYFVKQALVPIERGLVQVYHIILHPVH